MVAENVYIALIFNSDSVGNITSYDDVIILFNSKYPNNKLIMEKYLVDGSKTQTYIALENFIQKYSSGKRATVSSSSVILIDSSSYFIKNNLNILSISVAASSSIIKTIPNVLTYKYLNQSAVLSNFIVYQDYQMKQIHVLYQKNTSNDILLKDILDLTIYQSNLLNINISVSFLEQGQYNYNIKPKSMVIILGNTEDLINIYITPQFLKNFPSESFIILSTFNRYITNIFGDIPAFVQLPTNINYTTLSKTVYDAVKNNPDGFDFTIYPFYDILFVLNDFTINGLEITKENYVSINPYGSSPPAWLLNTSISPITNSTPYGKYEYTFTKDVIIGNDKNLFLKYYDGGQQQLPDSYSIFKIAGITPNNPSLIEYDEAIYYEIYDSNNKLVCVKFNSDITNFPIGKNLNVGKTVQTKFIYKYNDEGYFIKLERLYPYNGVIPQVNSTMSKVPIKLKYII
jgi:hypothetical protein